MKRGLLSITFLQHVYGIILELKVMRSLGNDSSGSHKAYHVMLSSSGWLSRIGSPQVFLCGSGGYHKVVCSVERGKKVETIVLSLSYHIHHMDYTNSKASWHLGLAYYYHLITKT